MPTKDNNNKLMDNTDTILDVLCVASGQPEMAAKVRPAQRRLPFHWTDHFGWLHVVTQHRTICRTNKWRLEQQGILATTTKTTTCITHACCFSLLGQIFPKSPVVSEATTLMSISGP